MVTFDNLKSSGVIRANPDDSRGLAPNRLGRGAPINSVSNQVPQFRTEIQDVEALEAPIGEVESTQFSTTAKTIVWPQFHPEVDSCLRLDDTKWESVSDQVAQLTNGAVHPDVPIDTHPNDILGFPGAGTDDLKVGSTADALVHQVQHGCFEMEAGMGFSSSAFESLGADTIVKPQTDDALIAVVIITAMQSEPGSETFV